jgi:2-alkenal reductase
LNSGLTEGLNLDVKEGVLVVQIIPGSPAAQAGLRGGHREVIVGGLRIPLGGDIITGIDDHKVTGMKQMVRLIDKLKVGETMTLRILRDGQPMDLKVLLAERP